MQIKNWIIKIKGAGFELIKEKNTVKISEGNIWISFHYLQEVVKLRT